ncbi:MAG: alpha/beta hydrolase [Solirubrobacterales bacterium]|nr:alpha/beta hydrolase [Solirubrobacterales bacterium]
MTAFAVPTPVGEARVHLTEPGGGAARGAVVLGHGAGGGIAARDLLAAERAALNANLTAALVEQPYRVAGRRSAPPATRLDLAWLAVLEWLRERLGDRPVVCGGRSSGARVACRTAAQVGAVGVLCLAFPLRPPTRAGSDRTPPSRLGELEAVPVPTLVVQGANDRFGVPPAAPGRDVVVVTGDHALRGELPRIAEIVELWLAQLPVPAR